jgi:hypothetical protein
MVAPQPEGGYTVTSLALPELRRGRSEADGVGMLRDSKPRRRLTSQVTQPDKLSLVGHSRLARS